MSENVNLETKGNIGSWYDKYYKIILFFPTLIFLLSIVVIWMTYVKTGDFIYKDISLTGGTTITINGNIDSKNLENRLKEKFSDLVVRSITDSSTGENIAVIIESSSEPEVLKEEVQKILGYDLTDENHSLEFSGASLSKNFYWQLVVALVFSFFLMSFVVFFLFRNFVPSIAVISCALADLVMSVAFLNFFQIKISAAGISAFLMLIGYSVDTDILLTTRVLKRREGSVNQRIFGAFKTGIFMTLTAILAVVPAFFLPFSLPDAFKQIFLILGIGLFFDIINTWVTNAGLIKWYTIKKGIN